VRTVAVEDPAGHFVEIMQPETLSPTSAPASANVIDVTVSLTVADVETSVRLYGEVLGMKVIVPPGPPPATTGPMTAVFDNAELPVSIAGLQIPTSGIKIELVEFAGAKTVAGRIQDFGSTRMQIRVNDIEEAIAAFNRFGGEVISTGGVPLDLPAGNGVLKVAIVRDPNNLFVVLIQAPPAA
jgi:catechol 2,3-dioxygenase-like lactoylglutathione lyase family enzyme